jgi:hypothetical protein
MWFGNQCMFIIKLSIFELYVCKGDIEKLHTQHLENLEYKKFQWKRKWKGNTLVLEHLKVTNGPCFKKYFEETPKYDKWCTHTQYF